jgi:hypothetical protein
MERLFNCLKELGHKVFCRWICFVVLFQDWYIDASPHLRGDGGTWLIRELRRGDLDHIIPQATQVHQTITQVQIRRLGLLFPLERGTVRTNSVSQSQVHKETRTNLS